MAYPTLTIKASALRGLLVPISHFADKGFTLPALGCIWLKGHGDYVTATATDRYRLGMKRAKVESPKFEAVLHGDTVRRILEIFKPTRAHDPELSLTFEPGRVTVSTAGGMSLLDASVGFPLYVGEDAKKVFPQLHKVLRDAEAAPAAPLDGTALNAAFLADFRHAVTDRAPMIVRQGEGKPLYVEIGDDFRGVLMPMREKPSGLSGDWAALVAEPAAKTAPKRSKKGAVA